MWRRATFLLGLAAIYGVLQTHHVIQHMFFLNRIQHVVTHHLGPSLIALEGLRHFRPLCRISQRYEGELACVIGDARGKRRRLAAG